MNFLEKYYTEEEVFGGDSDRRRAVKRAISSLLPAVFENELTKQQELCLKYKYLHKKSQKEIARLLRLSQPTVSRRIQSGEKIINEKLKYCWAAASAALEAYEQ